MKDRTIIVGAGMAGLAAAITLSSRGERVVLLEKQTYPGGKMRQLSVGNAYIDAGPTVFTMKWVFENLFDQAGLNFTDHVQLNKASTLARHVWDHQKNTPSTGANGSVHFDLHASEDESRDEIGQFFGKKDSDGYERFCRDAKRIFETLQHTFIAAPRPNPIELTRRVGFTKINTLLALRPFTTLWRALEEYFPDPRLRQLFGRYATYVGSSPFLSPATLMLIAHVEQDGVWYVEGGMHALALAMRDAAVSKGVEFKSGCDVSSILVQGGKTVGVRTVEGEDLTASKVIYCGDASRLTPQFFSNTAPAFPVVKPKDRALSAITWNLTAKTSGMALHRHNVFFSNDYPAEFESIFKEKTVPQKPTVYVCAQNRDAQTNLMAGEDDHLLCLINAPAFGDTNRLTEEEITSCQHRTFSLLQRCGLDVAHQAQTTQVTQPADFEALFPGSGGALYGRSSHGWMASFARPGAATKLPGFYLAGGSVHPGAGVPMATLSGQLAAQQMLMDHGST